MCQKSNFPKILILDWDLDFKRPSFPNRLSYNAEILRQSSMQTAGRTQTSGRTAAKAGYL
jgi:hypothetical protein